MSLILAMMACGLFAMINMLIPDEKTQVRNSNVQYMVARSIAIQAAVAIDSRSIDALNSTFNALLERDDLIRSLAIRDSKGTIVAGTDKHSSVWQPELASTTSGMYIGIPMLRGEAKWGELEVVFNNINLDQGESRSTVKYLWTILFLAIGCFVSYLLFLRRVLNDLDPNAVVPQRVRSALDVLAEGLIVVDKDDMILLANRSFCKKIGRTSEHLLGNSLSSLNWSLSDDQDGSSKVAFPWLSVLAGEQEECGATMKLVMPNTDTFLFTVHAVPVEGEEHAVRGAIVTFDDQTDVETKNHDLRRSLDEKEKIESDLSRKNKELHVLATRDALSNTFNRRALFEAFEILFGESGGSEYGLSCIMVDIDKFKSINDRFGHGVGDQVIRKLADILNRNSRTTDIVGRYGGEEFCILLPDTSFDKALEIAEVFRNKIETTCGKNIDPPQLITASFGVSNTAFNAKDPIGLSNQADHSLYVAKDSGRNAVVGWPEALKHDRATALVQPTSTDDQTKVVSDNEYIVDDKLLSKIRQLEEDLVSSERARHALGSDDIGKAKNVRSILHDRLDQALVRGRRSHTIVAVMIIEFAAYRDVNSALGISFSECLIEMADHRLVENLRETDTVSLVKNSSSDFLLSRSGDDSFVLILVDIQEEDAMVHLVARIEESMSRVFEIDGNEFYVSPRFGIAMAPDDGDDAITLMANANVALGHARKSQVEDISYRFFTRSMNDLARDLLRLESELHRAIEREEFVLFYQPRVDCASGEINGFEALVRWNHPTRGLVPPDSFISLVEKSRLIESLGEWVVVTACRQLADWSSIGYHDLDISINVSPIQMRSGRVLETLKEQVVANGLSASRIEVELTESIILGNLDDVVPLMQAIVDAGFRIALDDFGTGYSSLAYLRKLPLHILKIDRSFIKDLNSQISDYSIVSAVIEMAHALDLKVVVEGVDMPSHWAILRELGCDELQGYMFGRPLGSHETTELLSQHSGAAIQRRLLKQDVDDELSLLKAVAIRGVLNDANWDSSLSPESRKAG